MMKSIIYVCTTIIVCGCNGKMRSVHPNINDETCLYSVIIDWEAPEIYDWGTSGWNTMVMPSGVTSSITAPIPDSVTFTWKTALPGGKEYYQRTMDNMPQEDFFDENEVPHENPYPSDLFQDQTATIVLKDKIPQCFQGDIYLTVKESGDIVLRYVERQRIEDRTKYTQMGWYRIFIVNNQSPGNDIYDLKGTDWPVSSFGSLPVEAGYISQEMGSTVPPKKTTLTWKTALPGGKEYYDNFNELISEPSETYKFERYPSDKFLDHQVTVEIDSDKIVEYGFGAQLIFYIYDGDKVEVEYRARGE